MIINVSNAKKLAKKLATWHAIALTLNALTVIIADMSQQTALTKFHPQAYQQDAETITLADMIDPHLRVTITIGITTMTIEIGTGLADLDLAPITLDIGVTVIVTLAEVALDHFTNPHDAAHHTTEVRAYTVTTETCHTADPLHTGVFPQKQWIQDKHFQQTPLQNPEKPSSSSHPTPWKSKDRKYKQVTIDDPPSEYYSSDEQDSDSEDDVN